MTEKKDPEAERRDLSINIAAVFMGVGLVLFAANTLIPTWYSKPESAAEYGDMFGGVNALFSGLAFVGLIWAIMLQKQELGLQRQELKDTRQELRGQKEQLELQNATFKQQAFDSVFFQMISLHNQLINDLAKKAVLDDLTLERFEKIVFSRGDPEAGAPWRKGRGCFKLYFFEFVGNSRSKDSVNKIHEEESNFFNSAEIHFDLDHYFRNLTTIFNYIHQESIGERRYQHFDIILAQLSSYELSLAFYHGLSHSKDKNFKTLVEKYSLFRNLSEHLLIDPTHKEWYDPSAYGTPDSNEP